MPSQIIVEVGNHRHVFDPEQETRIDPDNLLTNLTEHPARFAYIANLAALAKLLVREADDFYRALSADIYAQEREAAAASGRKVTEASLSASVASNAAVIQAKEAQRKAELASLQLSALLDAMAQRGSMLVSIVRLTSAAPVN